MLILFPMAIELGVGYLDAEYSEVEALHKRQVLPLT